MARNFGGSQAAKVAGLRGHRGAGGRELLFGGAGRTRENRSGRKGISVPEERCSVSGRNAKAVSLRKAGGSADGERVGEGGDDTDSVGAGFCKNEAERGAGRSAAPRAASFLQNPAPTLSVSSPPSPTRSPSALPPAFRNETALAFPSLTLHLSAGTLIPFRPPRFSLVRPAPPKNNSRPPALRCPRSPATSAA